MKSRFLAAALLALAPLGSALSAPVASGLAGNQSFQQYTGTAAVGNGQVNTPNVLWYVDEGQVGNTKSWLIFFDPRASSTIAATLTFDGAITQVLDTRLGLIASHALYSVDIDGDGTLDDYQYPAATGLDDGQDAITWSVGGKTLQLSWTGSNPGDHIRVLTTVPEPASLALAGLALGAAAWVRRRKA